MIGHWWAWANASARRKRHLQWLVLLMVVSVAVQAVLWTWYIEDAAISFAYARNLATGEGLVPYPAGERVEGYSNPTWVFLLAVGELLGIDSFSGAKILGALFGALTLPFAYLLASELRPDEDDDVPVYAAVFLAGCSQFTIWNTSGLENSLFNFLLAVGLWRTIAELKPGRWPIGPFAYFLLAITRPEGIMYGAAAGFWAMAFSLGLGQGLWPTLRWLGTFFAPWTIYQVWHYNYFAWPLPNTYYAKTEDSDFAPYGWDKAGWKYIRNWAKDVGQGPLLPLWMVGITGFSNARQRYLALFASAVVLAIAAPGSDAFAAVVQFVSFDSLTAAMVLPYFLGAMVALGLVSLFGFLTHQRGDVPFAAAGVGGVLALVLVAAMYGFGWSFYLSLIADSSTAQTLLDLAELRNKIAIFAAAALVVTGGIVFGKERDTLRFALGGAVATVAIVGAVYYLQWSSIGFDPFDLQSVAPAKFRVAAIALFVLALPRLVPARPGWRVIVLCCDTIALALFFALWSGGDWMKGFRWMAALTVPASVLFASTVGELGSLYQSILGRNSALSRIAWYVGLPAAAAVASAVFYYGSVNIIQPALPTESAGALISALWVVVGLASTGAMVFALWRAPSLLRGQRPDRWGWPATFAGAVCAILFLAPHINHLNVIANKPETSPKSVKRRVDYINAAAARLHVDTPIVNIDVDQGAHLWWSGHQMLDIAGLVDMSMAHQKYKPEFIREYIFAERKPQFAHVHGGWANKSKINKQPEWKRDYFEIPGYPTGKSLHVGNHVRRDLFIKTEWPDVPERHIQFEGGTELVGYYTAASEVGTSDSLYLEVALRIPEATKKGEGFRMMAFLANDAGDIQIWDLPPGYDWYTTDLWKKDEIVWGRFSLPVNLKEGSYDLGFVVFDLDGKVLSALSSGGPGPTLSPAAPRFLPGEVLFPGAMRVLSAKDAETAADAAHASAITKAKAGDCAGAESSWDEARRRMTKQDKWLQAHKGTAMNALAACLAAEASKSSDQAEQVALISKARRFSHLEPTLLAVAAPLAEGAYLRGKEAYDQQRWEDAYRELAAAVAFEPWRAWAKRYMEEARAHRLGIDPDSLAKKKADADAKKKRPPVQRTLPRAKAPGEEEAPEPEEAVPGPEADEE